MRAAGPDQQRHQQMHQEPETDPLGHVDKDEHQDPGQYDPENDRADRDNGKRPLIEPRDKERKPRQEKAEDQEPEREYVSVMSGASQITISCE